MDLKHTTTTTTAVAGKPDTETETPLHSQPIKIFSPFPIGKNHHRPPSPAVPAYKECLKNHAAGIGSHAVDGCGEFIPPEPTSLKCAACGCHRNFHRRESTGDFYATAGAKPHFIEYHHPPPQPTNYAYAPHMLLSLSTAAAEQATTHTVATPGTPAAFKFENPSGRKRFRTKFSHEQKEKMSLFAEKVGWKMQRCDDKMVMDFCNEIGIRRGILKVWMHNNKNTFGKKEKETRSPATTAVAVDIVGVCNNGGEVSSDQSREEDINVDESSHQESGGVHLQASTNGSYSSS